MHSFSQAEGWGAVFFQLRMKWQRPKNFKPFCPATQKKNDTHIPHKHKPCFSSLSLVPTFHVALRCSFSISISLSSFFQSILSNRLFVEKNDLDTQPATTTIHPHTLARSHTHSTHIQSTLPCLCTVEPLFFFHSTTYNHGQKENHHNHQENKTAVGLRQEHEYWL